MSYLHSCLDLHGEVTGLRYGKVQRLDVVERDVQDTLADGGGLWDVIRTIHDHPQFGADMFGFCHRRSNANSRTASGTLRGGRYPPRS